MLCKPEDLKICLITWQCLLGIFTLTYSLFFLAFCTLSLNIHSVTALASDCVQYSAWPVLHRRLLYLTHQSRCTVVFTDFEKFAGVHATCYHFTRVKHAVWAATAAKQKQNMPGPAQVLTRAEFHLECAVKHCPATRDSFCHLCTLQKLLCFMQLDQFWISLLNTWIKMS